MILDSSLISLQIVLTAAKTTNDMDVTVDYLLWNTQNQTTKPATYRVATNGVTDVTILAAPPINFVAEPLRICIYNKDTADKIVIVKTDNGTTEFIDIRKNVTTLTSLIWTKATDWYSTT